MLPEPWKSAIFAAALSPKNRGTAHNAKQQEPMKQRCISRKILICCLALGTAFPAALRAQFEDRLYRTDYRPDPARTGELRLGL